MQNINQQNVSVVSEFQTATVVLKLDSTTRDVGEAEFPKITMQNAYKLRQIQGESKKSGISKNFKLL